MVLTKIPLFEKKKNLALVLSGGVARGIAHIGVLEVLEENKIPIDVIVGTSMGALIGGIYACGKLNDFKREILNISNSRLKSMFWEIKIKTPGRNPEKSVGPFLNKFIKGKKIEDLGINFTAVATDLSRGKAVYVNKGSLVKAISASICLPGIFQPVIINRTPLVDGGVVEPLPQSHGFKLANKVISVNAMPKKLLRRKNTDFYNMLLDVSNIMSNTLINMENTMNLATFKPTNHVFIQLATENRNPFDFYRLNPTIKLGRKAAKRHIKEIIELVKS